MRFHSFEDEVNNLFLLLWSSSIRFCLKFSDQRDAMVVFLDMFYDTIGLLYFVI